MLKKLRTSVSLVCKGGDNFGWLMNATSEEMSLDSVRRKLSKYWYLENFLLFAAPLISIGGDMEGRLMNIKLSGTLKVLFWYLTNFFKILHQPNVNGRKVLTRVVGWWTLCAKSSGKWLSWQRTPTLSENQYNRGKGRKIYPQKTNKYQIDFCLNACIYAYKQGAINLKNVFTIWDFVEINTNSMYFVYTSKIYKNYTQKRSNLDKIA